MATGYVFDEEAVRRLHQHVERLTHQVYELRQRVGYRTSAERSGILVAKVGASIIDAQASGTAQSATVTIQKLDPSDGTISEKTPAHTETAYNIYDQSIPDGAYVLIAREFENGAWVILSRVLTFWRFTLNEAFSGGDAAGDILEMDGTDTGDDMDIEDPLAIFSSDLGNGDAGICFQQGGVYYAVQAPCPS